MFAQDIIESDSGVVVSQLRCAFSQLAYVQIVVCFKNINKILLALALLFTFKCEFTAAQTDERSKMGRGALIAKAQSAYRSKDFKLARKLGDELLRRDRKEFGISNEVTWGSMVWQRCALEKLKEFDLAIQLQKELLEAKAEKNGANHWLLTSDKLTLRELQQLQQMTDTEWQQVLETRLLMSACRIKTAANQSDEGIRFGKQAIGQLNRLFGADCWQTISVYNNLSIAAVNSRSLKEAVRYAERALDIQIQHFGKDHPDTGLRHNTLGSALADTGKRKEAEQHYERALEIVTAVRGRQHRDIGLVLNNLGDLHRVTSKLDLAKRELAEAIQIREMAIGKRHVDTVVSKSNLGVVLSESGELQNALGLLDEVLRYRKTRLGIRTLDTASSFNNKGTCLFKMGRISESIDCIEQSLSIYRNLLGPDHGQTIGVQNNLGMVYSETGDLARALNIQKSALAACQETEDQTLKILCLNNVASVYRDIGDFQSAMIHLIEAKNLALKLFGKQNEQTLLVEYNLADLQRRMGEPAEAAKILKDCYRRYCDLLDASHPKALVAASGLAHAYLDSGNFELALKHYQEVLLARKGSLGNRHPKTDDVRNDVAVVLMALDHTDEAEKLLKTSLQFTLELYGDKHSKVSTTLQNLAELEKRKGNFGSASKLLEQSVRIIERNVELLSRETSDRQLIQLRMLQQQTLHQWLSVVIAGELAPDKVFESILQWKSFVFRRQSGSNSDKSLATREELIEINQKIAAILVSEVDLEGRVAMVHKLNARKEKLETILVANKRDVQAALTVQQLGEKLGTDSVLLTFLEYVATSPAKNQSFQKNPFRAVAGGVIAEKRMAMFVISKSDGLQVIDIGTVELLAQLTSTWRQTFGGNAASRTAANGLSKLIWEPVAELAKNAKHLIVSPDGVLAKFPLTALPLSENSEELLIDRFVIRRTMSTVILDEKPAVGKKGGLLLVGDVDYDAKMTASLTNGNSRLGPPRLLAKFERLSGTAKEVEVTENLFRQSMPQLPVVSITGQAAEKVAVSRALSKARFAVLATHGFYHVAASEPTGIKDVAVGYHPEVRSGIALAGANLPGPEAGDGILTALEIKQLDLGHLEVAALTSCWSGSGLDIPGEGVLGWNRSFLAAGCQNTVSTLAPVDDTATQLLMKEFWANLLAQKKSPEEALRLAQLKIRQEYDPTSQQFRSSLKIKRDSKTAESTTQYWAPFVVSSGGL